MSLDFDETFAEISYNKKKIELSTRIAQNREKRIQLQKELGEYQRIEKTGIKSFEDPQKRQEILKIQETFEMESKLNHQLEQKVKDIAKQKDDYDSRIMNLSNMIQKHKEEKLQGSFDSNLFLESRSQQLQNREEQLKVILEEKEKKIKDLKTEIERIQQELEKSALQKTTLDLIDGWRQGHEPEKKESHQIAFKLFRKAVEAYQDSKQSLEAEILNAFYRQIRESLLSAIDCVYILALNDMKNYQVVDYIDKIDQLFAKKIVVNPIMIEKLDTLVQKIEDGVEISPNLRFRDDSFEYLEKNLRNLRMING